MSGAKFDKDSALRELDLLIERSRELSGELPFSEAHTAWVFRVRTFLSEVFGEGSVYYENFAVVGWEPAGQAIIGGMGRPEEVRNPQLGVERVKREGLERALGTARGILTAASEALSRESDVTNVYESKNTGPEASLLIRAINLAEHKLRKVLRAPPTSEKDVQDAFETLLIGADLPFSRESKSIEYSSKTYKPDFTIDRADLAIEIKACLDGTREKALPAEINDDILAYGQEYGNQLFVIYDTGNIRDVDRFTSNFEEQSGVVVVVVKH
jgi:hypothetical protein